MKKLLLPLLITSMFANAKVTTGVGEYRYGPDTSEEDACILAEQMAKEDAISRVSGEEFGTTTFQHCQNEECETQRNVVSDKKGYIKEILDKDVRTGKSLGYNYCEASIRADVQFTENEIKFKLHNDNFQYNEGDEIVISGFVDRPGTIVIYNYIDGIYRLVYGEKFASYDKEFVLPSTDNRIVALLPDGALNSKELIMVLFTEVNRDFKMSYNKVEMEDFLNTIPFEKKKVINNYIYIMKKGNTI